MPALFNSYLNPPYSNLLKRTIEVTSPLIMLQFIYPYVVN